MQQTANDHFQYCYLFSWCCRRQKGM